MATVRNKWKLAAVPRETKENTRNSHAQNTFTPGMIEAYITQVSEEIERRVINKLSQEFSRTESRILRALPKLDEFHLNPQIWTCSVVAPGTSRNNDSENRKPTGDRSLNDLFPEVEISASCNSNSTNSDPKETSYMVTGVQEKIPYCSPGTSSGKQKKERSTSQPQFRSENTSTTIEANQILLALQQLATNSNSAIFKNNISRSSKLSKSLKTIMPTFDGKS